MQNIPIVPGRGLTTQKAIDLRLTYLKEQDLELSEINKHHLPIDEVRYNIESFIGSVEIPAGLVGPLLYNEGDAGELVYCAAGTLEGALIASMNRGAKAISRSGGFSSVVLRQRMSRSPLFIFNNLSDAFLFRSWAENHFKEIKKVAESYTNHGKLVEIRPDLIGKTVHLTFFYETGDASGQNMTTTCTWHAMLWIADNFKKETNISIEHFVIEGNGASDKKVSHSNMINGRGVHVVAECFLKEEVINRVLRTTSEGIFKCFNSSLTMSKLNGMTGYNINAANAIAAIFVATGQDLASIAESSNALLNVEKTADGLYLSLNLPSLVIGTVGGGTHLKKQREALELMGCAGSGKLERFARLIAGFTLSLEISTYSAIVSGEFAKAHEKLGRNKPVNTLLKSELTTDLLKKVIKISLPAEVIKAEIAESELVDNGIITNITNRVSKKLIGFIPINLAFAERQTEKILLKSKALDSEVIKGLHSMAASIDTGLADLIKKFRNNLEYKNCHLKELELYADLHSEKFDLTPKYYGKYLNQKREIFLLAFEFLDFTKLELVNSENKPELWRQTFVENVISEITTVHRFYESKEKREKLKNVTEFKAWLSKDLYKKLTEISYKEERNLILKNELQRVIGFIDELESLSAAVKLPQTIIHNDFNPRNVAVRTGGKVCIYDWELSTVGFAARDIVEFLSFVLPENFSKSEFLSYLNHHRNLYRDIGLDEKDWLEAYSYSIKEYLATRVSFYATAGILYKYKFTDRLIKNCFSMLDVLRKTEI